jgi:hypothetical protein
MDDDTTVLLTGEATNEELRPKSTSRFTTCFTICLFISPDLDGHRAPEHSKMDGYVWQFEFGSLLSVERKFNVWELTVFHPEAGLSSQSLSEEEAKHGK